MSVRFTILGSGSSGNCALLEAGDTQLLIDAGFSARQIRERLAGIGRSPERLSGILITHEHSDHIRGLGTLCGRLGIPIYANRLTREAIQKEFKDTPLPFVTFETGGRFSVGSVEVQTFSVPHDAMDPVGFVLETHAGSIGFLTDLGHATKLILERVRPARLLLLEANHDLRLLQEDMKRPWSLKQRILGRHGHLSNDAAAEVAGQLAEGPLEEIHLGHLSRECNRPELALKTVSKRLASIGATRIRVFNTSQDEPSRTVVLDPPGPGLDPSPATPPPG